MTRTPTPEFLTRLAAALPHDTVRPRAAGELDDPRGRYEGRAAAVARPRTVDDVATIVRMCNEAGVGVVPLGGGTGLVLGQVAYDGAEPIALSLERMTAVRAVYPSENVIVVEAGAILAQVQAAAEAQDRLFPLSLAAEGSCRIGGNLATNAGGLNVLRYGNTRDLCLGLEVVMPTGEIWHGLKRLRKDNTGYDLKNLMIGSEGTLGVITAAALRLYPRPAQEAAAFMVVRDPQGALDLLSMARDLIGEGISAFELISGVGLDFLTDVLPDVRQPFETRPDWCVLVDVGLSGDGDPQEALGALFEAAHTVGIVEDGVISASETQRAEFWAVRENIPEGNKRVGAISSHDISVPLSRIPDFIPEGIAALEALGDIRVNCFGHLGDGNLHYNVFPARGRDRKEFDTIRASVKQTVHDLVHAYDGSVSAEHGVGRLKVDDLERYQDPIKLAAMRAIKDALDPNGIMNPGAVLRARD
ncbi:FAD-binding oxidoreductase [Celeribacter marinus]|uniref:D-2-hydroxyglutarate dehydrogenase n=1 Tax=Celeribacter marinus TaxID=1397108 RepID=A0A0P0ACG7_9RHOB|nr:FAD-binding oxidoreductase [Celeribacter marinus]ALI56612.1 D-2-hydroxyglutarate dehydrogenase [Celeribacter marinus]SFK60505.1 FAD/FMN-containing dehydrogenase [Celeribacter marinus]